MLAEAAGAEVVAALRVALLCPSGHGQLLLSSSDPMAAPRIELNFASEPEDMRRFLAGLRLAWQVANAPGMAGALQRIACLDEAIISSDSRLTEYVRTHVGTYRHALGTVPMGVDDDPCAVLDQHCRVRGLDSLSVVDASVFPTVPRVVGHLTLSLLQKGWQRGWLHHERAAAP